MVEKVVGAVLSLSLDVGLGSCNVSIYLAVVLVLAYVEKTAVVFNQYYHLALGR